MNANEKLALWVGVIYGAFLLIAVAPMMLFSSQQNEGLVFQIASGAFCLTLLPSALIGLSWKKLSGAWMMVISVAAACALCLNEIAISRATDSKLILGLSLLWWTIVCAILGICGLVLIAAQRQKQLTLRQ